MGGKTLLAATPLLATMETVHLLAMTAGLALAPVPALAALITWSAQPRLVFGGRYQKPPGKPETAAWRPPEVGLACLSRLPSSWARNIGTLLAGFGDFRAREADRAQTPVPQPPPAEELFEPRRHTCPWCDSRCIVGRLDTTDLFLQRPGRFHLDWCTDCGHIFQNPAMSAKGLDHYYDQFYNGMGKELWVGTSAGPAEREDSHLDTMERLCRPRSWLDVGTGHGHFGLMVRQRWPDIVIDGLDMGDAVVEAQRRGWIDTAYVGLFPELANGLPRTYDVVSMHHYLEHTRDPRREITAAFEVLEPGGYLEIEVPNAESPWAQRLGRYWGPWLQPQHLHFVPRDNLTAALRENGFEIVVTERGSSPIGLELSPAGILVLQAFTRNPHLPWLPAPSLTDRAKRIAGIATVLPLMAVTAAIEAIVQARLGPDEVGSAYRVVARKP